MVQKIKMQDVREKSSEAFAIIVRFRKACIEHRTEENDSKSEFRKNLGPSNRLWAETLEITRDIDLDTAIEIVNYSTLSGSLNLLDSAAEERILYKLKTPEDLVYALQKIVPQAKVWTHLLGQLAERAENE